MATKRERRAAKIRARNTAIAEGRTEDAKKLASQARTIANKMREESDREKGERTVYTGPLTKKGREERGLPDMTKWQIANQGLLGALGGDRALLRQQFTPEMQAEYMRTGKIPEGFVPRQPVVPKVPAVPQVPTPQLNPALLAPLLAASQYGGGSGYGGYPVLGMGAPSGASYPAAAEAAEGYAGALGFNIGPEGGLVYRPWEAQAWQQSGIDPNLWNAPFAGGGLLGGGYPGGGQPGRGRPGTGGPITIPGGDTAAPTTPTARKDWWPNGATNDQMVTWMNQTGGSPLDWANSLYTLDEQKTGFSNLAKYGNIWGDVGDRARDVSATSQDYQPLTTQDIIPTSRYYGAEPGRSWVPPVTTQAVAPITPGAFGPSAEALAAAQAAAARTPYSYTPPTMAGPIPVPSVYTAPSWAQTGLLPPTTSGFVSDF